MSPSKIRNSFCEAVMAAEKAGKDGVAVLTIDALRVEPLSAGDILWKWVQPLMSPGGHIIGAPVPQIDSPPSADVQLGDSILSKLARGEEFAAKHPEHAIPVLAALASTIESSCAPKAFEVLMPVLAYGTMPGTRCNHKTQNDSAALHFISMQKHAIAKEFLADQISNQNEEGGVAPPPCWKAIKKAYGTRVSNKRARWLRRKLVSRWPRIRGKWEVARLRDECITPISCGHAVVDYVLDCWRLRPSSISSQLPKRPPAIVNELLEEWTRNNDTVFVNSNRRSQIVKKFLVFEEWVDKAHGSKSDPSVWSDTLSKFAKAVNGDVIRHNESLGFRDLVQATSFVPRDLAPEMYRDGECATGYFFGEGGWYYKYSNAWRADAYSAYLEGRLPATVDALALEDKEALAGSVSTKIAYQGGPELLEGLSQAGVSELVFTTFLRQYYWTGAFLHINLRSTANGDGWVSVDEFGTEL